MSTVSMEPDALGEIAASLVSVTAQVSSGRQCPALPVAVPYALSSTLVDLIDLDDSVLSRSCARLDHAAGELREAATRAREVDASLTGPR